jgi:hypothetical protein
MNAITLNEDGFHHPIAQSAPPVAAVPCRLSQVGVRLRDVPGPRPASKMTDLLYKCIEHNAIFIFIHHSAIYLCTVYPCLNRDKIPFLSFVSHLNTQCSPMSFPLFNADPRQSRHPIGRKTQATSSIFNGSSSLLCIIALYIHNTAINTQ